MMLRAWLLLADALVMLLLFGTLVFFILAPRQPTQNIPSYNNELNLSAYDFLVPRLELNGTTIQQEWLQMTQISHGLEYDMENPFLDRTLNESLEILKAKVGDPLFIRIFKQEALLEVWIRKEGLYAHLKDYAICAYSGELGPKIAEGDKQAPEGFYEVKKHQLNPNSAFHLSFNLGYPNAYDRQHKRSGSLLMVHGNCVSVGCYAMTDAKIEEIYALVEGALSGGQEAVGVHIFPFRMTEVTMAHYSDNEWYDFWENLKEGYDYFEAEHLPPSITVKEKRYDIGESYE